MAEINKNRLRKKTIAFRMSEEELATINARITIAGTPRGEYMRNALLLGKVQIIAGKFQSDRLSIELKRLSEQINNVDNKDVGMVLMECKVLLRELTRITKKYE